MSSFFKKNASGSEIGLNCIHETFSQQDLENLKITLDLDPSLFLIKEPQEEVVIHFKNAFDPYMNRDCQEQFKLHRNTVLSEIVPIIENGLIRDFQQDEKELQRMLYSLIIWKRLMENYFDWECCVDTANINCPVFKNSDNGMISLYGYPASLEMFVVHDETEH
jgi:hypothetical protein